MDMNGYGRDMNLDGFEVQTSPRYSILFNEIQIQPSFGPFMGMFICSVLAEAIPGPFYLEQLSTRKPHSHQWTNELPDGF